MTRLLLVTQGDRKVWVAALINDLDIWTYVGNTGRFHHNAGISEDYFGAGLAQYADIGIAEAKRLIADGVGLVDAEQKPDSVLGWLDDTNAMDPEVVFASMVADLA
ncbi:hypothetical protein E1263_42250 [Kribbella antibiotica]|uniref:Uncharacterized protein n=1 Tax=Kribbella antibiotica TaxID=190195 RepID=A0A4R4YCN9_9ACTN|nr:hypothetical protein [Kribbella antibiotica]TDD42333.1 hypothetical protein E1263_42250 [Kribbella antibiotica]